MEPNTANLLYMQIHAWRTARTETRDHACFVPVFLKKKHNNAHKAVWFTKATLIVAISAFVDSINSHIILQIIRESKKC